jgi:hypothetical protein
VNAALTALLGYAIGTAQILFVDWWRRRRDNIRRLRLIRAELRQVHERSKGRYGWDPTTGPKSDETPFPPQVSTEYSAVVAATDFYLTDEHDDDNTQQALLNIVDGVTLLVRYHDSVSELVDQARVEQDKFKKSELLARAVATAERYDGEANRLEYMATDALRDLRRRLGLTGVSTQVTRAMRGRLPPGDNPPPIRRLDDPRLREDRGDGAEGRVTARSRAGTSWHGP